MGACGNCFRLWLRIGVAVNSRNKDFSPVHLAAHWGEEAAVLVLLGNPKANFNSVNCLERVSLHLAEHEGVTGR